VHPGTGALIPEETCVNSRLRKCAAAVALAISPPTGFGPLAANTAFLAATADGGQPTIPYPFGPKVAPSPDAVPVPEPGGVVASRTGVPIAPYSTDKD
jgi:hypothetical protein